MSAVPLTRKARVQTPPRGRVSPVVPEAVLQRFAMLAHVTLHHLDLLVEFLDLLCLVCLELMWSAGRAQDQSP